MGPNAMRLPKQPVVPAGTRTVTFDVEILFARLPRLGNPRLVHDQAAVDVDGLAGDVAGTRARQKDDHRRDVLGHIRAADRNRRPHPLLELIDGEAGLLRALGEHAVQQLGLGPRPGRSRSR